MISGNKQPKWDIYEAVILLDGYLEWLNTNQPKTKIIKQISADLRRMATNRGTEIDDIYRNENGISYQIQSIDSAYKGKKVYVPATRLFEETVELYRTDAERYSEILEEAKSMVTARQNNKDVFLAWAASVLPARRCKWMEANIQKIEQFAISSKLISGSIFDITDISILDASGISYAQLPTRDNAIKAIADKNSAYLYWIDALGVEYLSYITALAKKKGLSIHTDIVRSDLPTITSINKQFYEQWTGGKKYKEEQLDNIKHKDKGGYFFTDDEDPIHIPAELEIIEKALNTAAMELGMHNCKSFVIASDHGASRLAVIKKQEVPYETDTKGEHSGRCCKAFDGCDVPYKVEDNGYIILSDYGRFRGSRTANVEVHGGASLEEIVVPVITLTLKKQASVQITVIHPDDITADRHDGVTLNLYISDVESPDNISLVIEDKPYQGKSEDGSHYTFGLKDIKRAKTKPYTADVFDGADLIGSVSFKVRGKTATVKDDFDFGDEF